MTCIPTGYKAYADILACLISSLINCSLRHQLLLSLCMLVNIIPIPKVVCYINKHLRSISEEFVIEKFVAPAISECIDPHQLGGIPRSSLTIALINLRWILFSYRNGFSLSLSYPEFLSLYNLRK
jgi:hypothetical protein